MSCLVRLSEANAVVTCFAPDIPQLHVIDHTKGAPEEGATRNVRVESGRIARGDVKDLATIDVAEFDAIMIPGVHSSSFLPSNVSCCERFSH